MLLYIPDRKCVKLDLMLAGVVPIAVQECRTVVDKIDLAGSDNMCPVRGLKRELAPYDVIDLKHVVPVPGNGLVRIAVKPGGAA